MRTRLFSALLAAAVTTAGFAVACGSSEPAAPAAPIEYQLNEPAAKTVAASANEKTVDIKLGEFYIKSSDTQIPKGEKVVFRVTNEGTINHDFRMSDQVGSPQVKKGETLTFEAGPFDSATQWFCSIPGHKEAGMKLSLDVAGGSSTGTSHQVAAAQAPASGNDATIDPNANPGPDWKPFDPALKPAQGGTEHKITFEASETQLEVAPGVKQEMWTFNGQTPGPILRGKVGDIFTVTLVNKGKVPHSIDFHASKVAWNDEMRTIAPGESLVYQFEAKFSGIWMYHCGTAPALHHIGNGMYGAVIIDPPNLPSVDKEFVLVQSELYLGPQGQPGDLTKMQNVQFDAVVFNGYFNQYSHAPIRVEPGQRVRVWVLDAGPSENSAFHIVGTIFDTVYKEGSYTLKPSDQHGGSQALDLQPAQGGFVEFTFDEAGLYPIVTHKFANVGKGALGLFQAGDVAAPAGGGH